MRAKLTAISVANAKCPPGQARLEIHDTGTAGFGLRVGKKGGSYFVRGRANGVQIDMAIGSASKLTLAEARATAVAAMDLMSQGIDPRTKKPTTDSVASEDDPDAEDAGTVAHAVRLIMQRYFRPAGRPARPVADDVQGYFRRHVLPAWGARPIGSITEDDVTTLLIEARAQILATHAGSNRPILAGGDGAIAGLATYIRRLFSWAQMQPEFKRLLPTLPTLSKKRLGVPVGRKRSRILSDAELTRVWQFADERPYPFGPWMQLMILTGQRRSEVANMRWADLDLQAGLWIQQGDELTGRRANKSDRRHELPLSPAAVQILRAVQRINFRRSEFVFTFTGQAGVTGFTEIKRLVDEATGIQPRWTFHDLRRTLATRVANDVRDGADFGFGAQIADDILNHAFDSNYNVTRNLRKMRRALDAWADYVAAAVAQDQEAAA
jgi:integrase